MREGLEAGLVVSILLAALRKTGTDGHRVSSAPVWLGVLGAVSVAAGFAAVLTFSTSVLSSAGQEAVGGLLSVLAVGLVTAMVFWMRRTAAGLSRQLRGEVERAAAVGAGALALTAFLAVGREGLETTLFLWTAVKASGSTAAPLVGAGLGLAAAVSACWLLYRQAVRLNLGVFFNRTALALIMVAAGVLAYGLGDLQDAGLLPGTHWIAFDLTAHLDPNSWWVSIITGCTELAPRMTVLQVVAWTVYLAVVVPLFVRAARPAPAPRTAAEAPAAATMPAATPAATTPAAPDAAEAPGRWVRLAGQRPWPVAAVLVVVPTLAATAAVLALPSAAAATVTVTRTRCAQEWTSARAGSQTIAVDNRTDRAGEIDLVNASGAVVAEIETIGPATTADMTATLGSGSYAIKCLMSGQAAASSASVQVSGSSAQAAPAAVKPVTLQELTGPNDAYQHYAAGVLARLTADVAALRTDLTAGNLAAAKADWLTAQLDWEEVGASYDSFGDAGTAVDGLPDGLPNGVQDSGFTGLHRLEYGLWHGQSAAQLLPQVATLGADVADVSRNLATDDEAGDPTNLPIRAHEIMEDALRDHLSGIDDEGAGAAYPETWADVQVTRTVLGELSGPLTARAPKLLPLAEQQLDALQSALLATRADGQWQTPQQAPQQAPQQSMQQPPAAARQQVDAAIGALLETLDQVPDLLEVPPSH
ncbi:iron uptake transporter permease EfeU [Streptacidiphilus sp. PB12-B1b]|uniref:iron uptake transporter permease EfeU n=1 Tax=Streptacidiphilus sp. PB12-B1b TaxID=2705012 RepID=UPI00351A7289